LSARNLLGGTAHVDINDVGACSFAQFCADAHPLGLPTGQLDDEGA
jgi:hypothetical protein